jgi:drug/metabolite transporter (DMT)-like permease
MPDSHHVPPRLLILAAVSLAVCATTSAGPLIAFAAAPGLALAFWRNAIGAGVIGSAAVVRRRNELRTLAPSGTRSAEGRYCALAGLALCAHFAAWVPSAQLTSVAASTALVATQPVWQALIARGQRRRPAPATWFGIGIAVAGAVLATGADIGVSGRAVAGDLLAAAGAVAGAVYTALGERARAVVSTTSYTTICYGVCALALLAVCLAGGVPATGFDTASWLAVLGLAAGPQLLGHSMFSYALRRISATTVSVLMLLEVPGAALLAWAWLGQTPRPAALPGIALLLIGVAVVLLCRGARGDPALRTLVKSQSPRRAERALMAEPKVDPTRPSSARVWNYLLGGKDNFAVDREVGEQIKAAFPSIVVAAREQRKFLVRAVTYLAGTAGIRQFLDIGTGLPSANNTHEVAQRVAPEARVVYVDNDPMVLVHARALLTGGPDGVTAYVDSDVEDPDRILRAAAETLDFSQPIGVTMLGILGNVADYDEARSIVKRLVDAVPSGSYLAVSDGTSTNKEIVEGQRVANRGGHPYNLRTVEEIVGYFDGLELVEPGVVPTPHWRPEPGPLTPAIGGYCGVARKP